MLTHYIVSLAFCLRSTKCTTYLADQYGSKKHGIHGLYCSWSASLQIPGDAFQILQRGAAFGETHVLSNPSREPLVYADPGTAKLPYRRFIKNFATLAAPLTESLKNTGSSQFSLSLNTHLALESLKMALTTAPGLVHADFKS